MMNTKDERSGRALARSRVASGCASGTGWRAGVCESPFDGCAGGTGPSVEVVEGAVALPVWKRCIDLICIFLSLPVLLPILLVVGIWIKLVSRGPVLFRQDRVGRGGRRFLLYKFRSMRVQAPTERHESHFQDLVEADRPMTKLDNLGDQRLILGGAIFRTLGLDELPQLINVLRGEMSIVGPRPCLPKEYNLYDFEQRERFDAVPGLTGYWQVNGKNRTKFSEMIAMDIYYSRNISLWLDLKIMAQTIPAILEQAVDSYSQADPEPKKSGVRSEVDSSLATEGGGKAVN